MNQLACRSLAIGVLSLALTAPVFAQRTAGPNAGVLGTTEEPGSRHTLTFRGALFGAWDDIITENFSETFNENNAEGVDDRFLRSGLAGGAQGGLTHSRRGAQTQWFSTADTALRVYGTDNNAVASTFAARSTVTSNLNSRVSVLLSGSWSYSPYYDLAPSYGTQAQSVGSFGGGFGVATAAERNMSTDGNAGLTVRLSRRDTVEASALASNRNFLDQEESNVTSYGGQVRYRRSLTRSLGVYGGYGRTNAGYGLTDTDDLTGNTIDVGIDYGDALEFSRRTALAFAFSTTAIQWDDETHYRVNGSATLTRAFGRTGTGLLQYRRTVEPAGGFREPLLTDTFSGGFSNQLGRNASWSVNGGYVRGDVGFEAGSRRVDVYEAGGRVTRALTRHLGVFGSYTYYRYEVPAGSTVFTFLPKFSRQSVSVGLNLWQPLINDTRPPSDTR